VEHSKSRVNTFIVEGGKTTNIMTRRRRLIPWKSRG
jgi:hypothetical protein